jgi:hypothetical protein
MPMVTSRAQLERPRHRLARLLVIDHDAKPSIQIPPFEFLHRALKGEGLFRIEHREGLVSQRRRRERGYDNGSQANDFTFMGRMIWPTSDIFANLTTLHNETVQRPVVARPAAGKH